MPSATAIPERFLYNRRSCEGAIRRGAITKAELNMNHRSVQSDPGISLDDLRRSGVLHHLVARVEPKAVVLRRTLADIGAVAKAGAGIQGSITGRPFIPSGYGIHPAMRHILDQDIGDYYYSPCPAVRRRQQQNRRTYVLDSQVLDHRQTDKVKSTSLSSSATSLYSEDDSRSSASPLQSISSCRSSCSFFQTEESESFEEENEMNNNNEEKDESEGIVKIDGNILVVNLRDFKLSNSENEERQEEDSFVVAPEDHAESCCSTCCSCVKAKESQTDEDDDDDDDECAISEFWHFEGGEHRWSRLDSKSSNITSPNGRMLSSGSAHLPHLDETLEDMPGDVFTNALVRPAAIEIERHRQHYSQSEPKQATKNKSSNSFLKRVGDLKKLRPGSFRRKDILQRTNSSDAAIELGESRTKPRHTTDIRSKLGRKNRRLVIGEPTLQSGHEKINSMRCVPIEVSPPTGAPRGRKNSSQSLISSSSSASGSASSSSTPASRMRGFAEDRTTRSDPGELNSTSPRLLEHNRVTLELNAAKTRNPTPPIREPLFVMPKGYKPGTFPSGLVEMTDEEPPTSPSSGFVSNSSSSRSRSTSDSFHASQASEPTGRLVRPMSIYDNLPDTVLTSGASAQDFLDIMDPSTLVGAMPVNDSGVFDGSQESLDAPGVLDSAFWSVDQIVEQTQSLQQMVQQMEEIHDDTVEPTTVNSLESLPCQFNSAMETLPSYSSENVSVTEDESEALSTSDQLPLSRQPRLRWSSFNLDHTASTSSESLQIHNLSVGQLMILRKLSVLKLTALMESYASNNNKGSLNWSVPRFIRRIKVPDYKDRAVFGVPLLHNVQRFGQPLPQCIQRALAYLRRTALDQVGLFRKPGVRSRIQKLRASCENNPELSSFDDCTAFDVADMVKQYFRELPDPLMTMKLSDTYVGIFLYVPEELRLQTLQAATMLLPDETRETLKTLLCFLSDVASRSSENHMNETNLATCFAPSLFHQQYGSLKTMTSASPKIRKQQKVPGASLGRPDIKEMNENMAANQCLAFMICQVKNLFRIPEDAMTQCRMSVMQQAEDVLASEIGYSASDLVVEGDNHADYHSYVDRTVLQTMREEQRISQNKGGWQNVPSSAGSDLSCKKMHDGNPLRLWRCQVEVSGATEEQLLERILHERHVWDDDLIQWKVLKRPDERTQLFQTARAEMSPHPTRDYCVLRSWRRNVNSRGASVIVETSTSNPSMLGDVRGVILASRYVIEPTDDPLTCQLTHVCRVDTKGRNPEWYNKAYGHVVVQQLLRIRDSVRVMPPKT
uniref:rho GTPase-activating protein 7 isoform X1 n=1 Tax=Ciona intestinalis TaxID=7719 RepID=UPI00006A4520|nr:rho GTPase-activating protein 7 isoform X1 [Ciona intestinalis]|eukprot:XP_026696472.1 rho GTPase-activating protein 7 isoform X1 [Ciona intestinalis]